MKLFKLILTLNDDFRKTRHQIFKIGIILCPLIYREVAAFFAGK
jgi:hypothetical protein